MKRKHIFVVTWYKSFNYGTCLQAYATYHTLENYAEVIFLDHRTYYSLDKINFLVEKIVQRIKGKLKKNQNSYMKNYEIENKRKLQKIAEIVEENYVVKSIRNRHDLEELDDWADYYMVGSDQMWNPWMLSPQYLLDFVPSYSKKPKLSYAASFGVDNIPKKDQKIYKKYLSKFSSITVREPRAAELVNELVNREAEVVLDPTFLLTQEEWRKFASQSGVCDQYNLSGDYILCYFIGSPEFDHLGTVKKIAALLEMNIVLIPMKQKDYLEKDVTIVADACAYDFVSLIENAKLVCTDSFHAVVFSFLMNTAFYAFPRFRKSDKYSQEARLQNIINKFKLENSYWQDQRATDIESLRMHINFCNYERGYDILEQERKQSLKILLDMIGDR